MPTLRLHHAIVSSSSWRVRIALAYKGLDYESCVLRFSRGDHQSTEHLRRNPLGQAPCLEVDGVPIPQSVAIIELLEELAPTPSLFPGDPIARAQARAIVEMVNAGTQPVHNSGLNRSLREQLGASDSEIDAWKSGWITKRLSQIEKQVATTSGRHAVGDEITIADVYLYPQLTKARDYGADLAVAPRLVELMEPLDELPSFRDTAAPEEDA